VTPADVFVGVMIVLQIGAVALYSWQGQWNQALYWFGALTINTAVLWRSTH
jgi:hypothetical protein